MGSFQSMLVRFLLRRSGMWNKPLPEIRRDMQNLKAQGIPEGIEVIDEKLNDVKCKFILHRDLNGRKILLYYHGGGFCLGIYSSNCEFVAGIAQRTGFNVCMPDYRLAPENPYPAALEDAAACYCGLLNKGYLPKDIVIMGDSSGCSLAVSMLLSMKQKGIDMPRALAFITPVLDLTGRGETFVTKAKKDPFKIKDPLGLAMNYVGANDPSDPLISPLEGDLKDLPPVIIHAADYDVFLSDSSRFRDKVLACNGKVELKVWKKMWHIFHMQAALIPEANKALEELCSEVRSIVNNQA